MEEPKANSSVQKSFICKDHFFVLFLWKLMPSTIQMLLIHVGQSSNSESPEQGEKTAMPRQGFEPASVRSNISEECSSSIRVP